ncbi:MULTISPECIES: HTH-type transcriptional activator RhaR [Tenebrionibacter/Tenebrionicola group]|uniref:HTH-type transcriptional activator RhaR n=2 Tax=Tenebrionibacter/Tenebrionicola group TaxID=2969848 RepID=A0A8K0V0G9_9ENTR|nr:MULTISPECIES: HTH-type transcriptional activator RhaR [Tenebrionibacter/Tenebrionicola group]MBK4715044.1 HTH-type transcriptional activator RhaR [Tenebrionibacter intestinalis]MBV5097251.1 HTH-type transcriptional activator RhaR [Tenebrionicola larvae]
MAELILRKTDLFTCDAQSVAVADRYPQRVFAEHSHDFCELVLVWRGNGLHVLNGRPYRVTRGDLFYIRAEDCHSYASVNDLVLQNIIWCPERLRLGADWNETLPAQPAWRLGGVGMTLARQIISQLEQESAREDALSGKLAEALFLQLLLTLQRHRYQPDRAQAQDESVLDRLIATLAASLNRAFDLDAFCAQHQCSERSLRQQFRQQTGMSINHYLRQLRICHAQYLLQRTGLLISEIAMLCGFEDSNYFSVVFTRETGVTPRQWRQRSGSGAATEAPV